MRVGSFGIGACLGVGLGPHDCAQCPVETGAAPAACGLICGQRKQGVTLRSQRVTSWNQRVRTGNQRVTNRAQLVEQQCEFTHRLLLDTESVLKTGLVDNPASCRGKRLRSRYLNRAASCCAQVASEKMRLKQHRQEQALKQCARLTIALRQPSQRQKPKATLSPCPRAQGNRPASQTAAYLTVRNRSRLPGKAVALRMLT